MDAPLDLLIISVAGNSEGLGAPCLRPKERRWPRPNLPRCGAARSRKN